MLSLLTYNIEYGKKLSEAGEWMMGLEQKPDVICLQEIPNRKLASFKKTLTQYGYDCKYAPAFTKKGVTYGQLTAFNKSMKLSFSQVIDLGSSWIGRLVSRHNSKWSALITVLRSGKQNFIVVNIHLLPHALNRKRRKQLELAIGALKLLNFLNVPTLIVGDYNYSSLIGRGGLIRFMAKEGFKIGNKKRLITHSKWKIKHQTDYVFYKDCRVRSVKSERLGFSDHFPVLIKFAA